MQHRIKIPYERSGLYLTPRPDEMYHTFKRNRVSETGMKLRTNQTLTHLQRKLRLATPHLAIFSHDEKEGPVSGGENTLPVGVDIRNARVPVFCACLDIMSCEPNSPKEPVALELRSYVASVWLELLRKIDITKTSEEDKEAIAHGLMSVLTKSPGLADVN
ncbi:hypothetical protein VC83_06855 [Pseudogymnoascus destructans]|uniref:Uncharacterized protein n=1 Tax=Pseudogymnoascus destructans TaxID=655981 RepID=A0A177A5L2_9PEZI|nr:uncharacterized protein VC83_06855 [Pseudogymnoascus destructans]OAF56403.1 hypothetical protein VC83_06855 [Pseudogymnoascus destructans]